MPRHIHMREDIKHLHWHQSKEGLSYEQIKERDKIRKEWAQKVKEDAKKERAKPDASNDFKEAFNKEVAKKK